LPIFEKQEVEREPVSLASVARSNRLPVKEFEQQYKDHLSGFHQWDQKDHAEKWMLFPKNVGTHLSIDEVAVTNGELYTVVTNKKAHGKKNALVAMVEGTKSGDIAKVLNHIPQEQRNTVIEATMDMAETMEAAMGVSFPNAKIVIDRFHVQQLVSEAVQEIRVELRREAIKEENEAIKKAKAEGAEYHPIVFENGDTKKQLLARSRYLLFKPKNQRIEQQKERAVVLFREYPLLKAAHELSMMFRGCYENSRNIPEAREKLHAWYKKHVFCMIRKLLSRPGAQAVKYRKTIRPTANTQSIPDRISLEFFNNTFKELVRDMRCSLLVAHTLSCRNAWSLWKSLSSNSPVTARPPSF
jgi:hypothetical protein